MQGADQVEIIEIIDHHRIGALTTQQPILFRNEPVGSTSTIVADCFFRHGVELPQAHRRPAAGGLGFRHAQPDFAHDHAARRGDAGEARKDFGGERTGVHGKAFPSGSLLTLKPAPQAITTDCKEYNEKGDMFSVAQIEEMGFDQFWKRKARAGTMALGRISGGEKGYSFFRAAGDGCGAARLPCCWSAGAERS